MCASFQRLLFFLEMKFPSLPRKKENHEPIIVSLCCSNEFQANLGSLKKEITRQACRKVLSEVLSNTESSPHFAFVEDEGHFDFSPPFFSCMRLKKHQLECRESNKEEDGVTHFRGQKTLKVPGPKTWARSLSRFDCNFPQKHFCANWNFEMTFPLPAQL